MCLVSLNHQIDKQISICASYVQHVPHSLLVARIQHPGVYRLESQDFPHPRTVLTQNFLEHFSEFSLWQVKRCQIVPACGDVHRLASTGSTPGAMCSMVYLRGVAYLCDMVGRGRGRE